MNRRVRRNREHHIRRIVRQRAAVPLAGGPRRTNRHQSVARGPRHPGMRAGRHPRRRQGGLPALETRLVQTIGRAARNIDGRVILYADTVTGWLERAMGKPIAGARSSRPTTPPTASRRKASASRSTISWRASTPRPLHIATGTGEDGEFEVAVTIGHNFEAVIALTGNTHAHCRRHLDFEDGRLRSTRSSVYAAPSLP